MDFDGFSDASLMVFMAMQGEDPDTAQEAFGEFFERHIGFLGPVVERVFGTQLGGPQAADDMTVEVFWRAYEHCGRADVDFEKDYHDSDPERSRKSVRAWLSQVAQNMFKDLLRQQSTSIEELEHDRQASLERQQPAGAHQLSPDAVQLVQGALAELTEKQRQALEACLPWYDTSTGRFEMGKDAPAVAESLGMSVESLKKNRLRAVRRLQALDLQLSTQLTENSHE